MNCAISVPAANLAWEPDPDGLPADPGTCSGAGLESASDLVALAALVGGAGAESEDLPGKATDFL